MFSTVQGRKIRVSDKVFGGALDISYRDWSVELIRYNNLEICRTMLDMEEDPSEKDLKNMNATVFPPLQRIIHHIITTIIFPKGGSQNEVTKVHKTIFHYLFNGELMNLPHLMCTLIDKVHFQVKRALPYAAHLTAVFQFVGVDLSSHQKIIIPPIHVYSKFNICSHMGYKLVDGQFGRTLGDDEGGSESDEEFRK